MALARSVSDDTTVSQVLDIISDQLGALEARAGRVAVRVSVAIPPSLDPAHTRDRLASHLGRERTTPPDVAVVQTMSPRSRARLITVDFELEESAEQESP